MKKTFLTAALACVLSVFGGFTLSADEIDVLVDKFVSENAPGLSASKVEKIKSHARKYAGKVDMSKYMKAKSMMANKKVLGYKMNDDLASLATLLDSLDSGGEAFPIGTFGKDDLLQFENAGAGNGFVSIGSDSGFHSGMDTDTFFKLDFPEAPFDGRIEVLVAGAPLPSPSVTLLVAFAAGAIFLLYNDRRKRTCSTEHV